jgi:hypothetical protein
VRCGWCSAELLSPARAGPYALKALQLFSPPRSWPHAGSRRVLQSAHSAMCRRRKVNYPVASRKHREGRYGSRTRGSDAGNKRIAGGLETFSRLRIRLAQQQRQRK